MWESSFFTAKERIIWNIADDLSCRSCIGLFDVVLYVCSLSWTKLASSIYSFLECSYPWKIISYGRFDLPLCCCILLWCHNFKIYHVEELLTCDSIKHVFSHDLYLCLPWTVALNIIFRKTCTLILCVCYYVCLGFVELEVLALSEGFLILLLFCSLTAHVQASLAILQACSQTKYNN